MNARARGWFFVSFASACVFFASLYVRNAARRSSQAPGAPGVASDFSRTSGAAEWIDGIPLDRPGIMFSSTAGDRSFKHVAFVPLDRPGGPRYLSPIVCDKLYFRSGRGLCLVDEVSGVMTQHVVYFFDRSFTRQQRTVLTGSPSRTRISSDGTLGAITVFESGHGYLSDGLSTRTTLFDMTASREIADLEKFRVERDGKPYKAVDFNFWGVTFVPGTRRFYATLASRGRQMLVEGDVDARAARVIRDGVECPSLSPDATRVAFKKRVTTPEFGLGWHLAILDLATLEERVLDIEKRSVDDQVDWLDNDTVLYFYTSGAGNQAIALKTTNTEPPRAILTDVFSPIVVR